MQSTMAHPGLIGHIPHISPTVGPPDILGPGLGPTALRAAGTRPHVPAPPSPGPGKRSLCCVRLHVTAVWTLPVCPPTATGTGAEGGSSCSVAPLVRRS